MAEKVELFTIEINTSDALKDLADSQKAVKALKNEIKELEKAEGDNTQELAELNANLKVQQDTLRTNTNLTKNAIKATNEQKGSINQLRAQLAVTTIEWNKLSEEERQNTERGQALTEQKLNLTEALKKEEKATGDTRRNVGNYTDSMKEAIEGTGGFDLSLLKLAANPIVLTIVLIVGLLKLLFNAFKSTQTGADKMSEATATLSAIFETLKGLLSVVAEALFNVFTEPRESAKSFGELIRKNITDKFTSLLKLTNSLSEAMKFLFLGEFEKASEAASKAVEQISDWVEETTDRIIAFGKKAVEAFNNTSDAISKSIELALELERATIAYEEANIKASESLAKLNAEAEKQSTIADDNTRAFKERQDAAEASRVASEEAIKIQLDLAQQELHLIELRNERLKINNQLLRENRQEEADLAATVIDIEGQLVLKRLENAKQRQEIDRDVFERNLDFLLDNLDNVKTINEKIAADDRLTFAERSNIIEVTKKLADESFAEQIKQLETRTEAEINANDLIAEADSKRLIEKVRLLKLDEIEEGRLLEVLRDRRTAIQDLAEAEQEIETERLEAKQEARLIDLENELEINRNRIFKTLDLEREGLELKREQELEFANKIGADTNLIEEKFSNARRELNRAEFNAKLSLAADFSANIATIAGKNTAIGKAAAVASATINTYQAATGAFAALSPIPIVGPALGIAAAGAAVVAGLANVKKILSVKSGLPGESGGVSGGSVSASIPSAPVSERANAVDDVNAGIISREVATNTNNDNINVQPTLVTDDVTISQNQQAANNQTATV